MMTDDAQYIGRSVTVGHTKIRTGYTFTPYFRILSVDKALQTLDLDECQHFGSLPSVVDELVNGEKSIPPVVPISEQSARQKECGGVSPPLSAETPADLSNAQLVTTGATETTSGVPTPNVLPPIYDGMSFMEIANHNALISGKDDG